LFGFLLSVTSVVFLYATEIRGSGGAYDASGLLGQFTATNTGVPDFTYEADSDHLPGGYAIDTVHHRLFIGRSVGNNGSEQIQVYNLNSSNVLVDKNIDFYLAIYSPSVVDSTHTGIIYDVKYDSINDRLFASDGVNNRVLVYDTATITNFEPAVNVLGPSSLSVSSPSDVLTPGPIYYDESNSTLYVSNQTDKVFVFDLSAPIVNGQDPDKYLGGGLTNAGTLSSPGGLTMDASNHLFVSDTYNSRVLVYDVTTITNAEDAVNVIGQPDLLTVNLPGLCTYTIKTTCVGNSNNNNLAYDPTRKYLFVSMINRILIFNITSISNYPVAINVLGQSNFTSSSIPYNLPTASTVFDTPGLAYDDGTKRLFVADGNIPRTTIFNLTSISNNLAATDLIGQSNIYSFGSLSSPLYTQNTVYSGGPINGVGLSNPRAVTLDSVHHRLFISDNSGGYGTGRILVYNLNSNNILTDNIADAVIGMAATNANIYYGVFSDYDLSISNIEYDPDLNYLFVTASGLTGDSGMYVFDVAVISQGENSIATLDLGADPLAMAYDTVNKRLFVSNAEKISVYNLADGLTDGESPVYTLGDGGTPPTEIAIVKDLAFDSTRNILFATDVDSNRVVVYDFANNPIADNMSISYVLGAVNLIAPGVSGTTASTFDLTNAGDGFIDYDDSTKQLFVSDPQNNRVLIFDTQTIVNGESAVAVIGQPYFTTSSASTARDTLVGPNGLVFDGDNKRLYLVDRYNNRVTYYDTVALTSASLANGVPGTGYSATFPTQNSQGTVSYELISGTLPPGLSFDATGISGTPTNSGVFSFTVRAIDTVGVSNFRSNQVTYSVNIVGMGSSPIPFCNNVHAVNNQQQSNCTFGPPVVAITSPSGSSAFTSSTATIAVSGTATDLDTITSVTYTVNGGPTTPTTGTTTWSIPALALFPGPNTVTVTATNNHGLSATDWITLDYYPNQQPPTCATNQNLSGCPQQNNSLPVCSDGLDNDGDSLIDALDPGCANALDTNETDPILVPPTCATNLSLPGCTTPNPIVVPVVTPPTPTPAPSSSPTQPHSQPQIFPSIPVIKVEDVAKTTSGVGIIVGMLLLIGGLFGGALSISELALIPSRLWTLLLGALGFKKKIKHWGVVFDSVTKQPIDPVYVTLSDANGKEISTAITDLEGRYGFLVVPGIYRIVAHKTNYLFPSRKLAGKVGDEIYADLYFGDYFEIKTEGEVITKNIPLDQEHFDWNEYIKHEKKLTRQNLMQTRILKFFYSLLFFGGLVSSAFALYLQQNTFTICAIVLYAVLLVLRIFVIKKPSFGIVSTSGEPVPYGVVKIYYAKLGTLLSTRVLDKYGRYYAIAPKGQYYVTVDKKNDDQSYTALHKSDPFANKQGVINKKIKIQ
jgi:sugar lactone lactonase YvrE